jgi:hypothetical protein
MAKKRRKAKPKNQRKNTNSPFRNVGLRKKYLQTLQSVCVKMHCEDAYKQLSKQEKIRAFCFKVSIGKLKTFKSQYYTSIALKFFEKIIQDLFFKPQLSILTGKEFGLTNLEILMASQLVSSFNKNDKKRYALLMDAFKDMHEHFGDRANIYVYLMWHYTFISNAINLFDQQMYNLKLDIKTTQYPTPGLYIQSSLECIAPRESFYIEKGKKRAVYQLGLLDDDAKMNWTFVSSGKLREVYNGYKQYLPVCIQRHAYHRFLSRLEPLREMELIWSLNHSLQKKLEIQIYRGNILIPYYYFEFKCGYFVAIINQNRLIIKTFLFLTQGSTPEGIKLAKLSGLSKEEMSYWKIGRLRNFIETKDYNHEMKEIFEQAGVSHLFRIDIDDWNEKEGKDYNWNALSAYIKRGKTELYCEGGEELDDEFYSGHEVDQY